MYIYLLGNVTGSFLKYFPGMQSEEELKGLTDQEKILSGGPSHMDGQLQHDGRLPAAGRLRE